MADLTKVRLVRCPNCQTILRELVNYSLYKCGACGSVLSAKHKDHGSASLAEKKEVETDHHYKSGNFSERREQQEHESQMGQEGSSEKREEMGVPWRKPLDDIQDKTNILKQLKVTPSKLGDTQSSMPKVDIPVAKTDSFSQVSAMADIPKIQIVRCPKCRKMLPEPVDCSVYKGGGCGAVLKGKKKGHGSVGLSEKGDVESDHAKSGNYLGRILIRRVQQDCVQDCDSLVSFPLSLFTNLEDLHVQHCGILDVISSAPNSLPYLRKLKLKDCYNLVSFPEGGLPTPKLESLSISNCAKLSPETAWVSRK
ncbi:hypothetical protein PIB30_010141 [Stylosanthes scabra]|uniref:Enhanced disease resistance 4-like N-terminal domain-containing protein n=1 Tax=Stylosanthes scabra TaxID=79078 RepID=A0ABU6Z4K1_9FABA|nr:hypothetical protein [Stylosanthes scabra]